MPTNKRKKVEGEGEHRNCPTPLSTSTSSLHLASADMPTVARIRERLVSLGTDDITMTQAVWVFGVSTKTPIISRIERGEIAAAKVMGEWMIDAASIHRYLDKVNKQFNRG